MTRHSTVKQGDGRPPRHPFVELAFYFFDQSTDAALSLLISHLIENGARLGGKALLGSTGSSDEMADLIYERMDRICVETIEELAEVRRDTGRVVAGVTLSGVQPGGAGNDVEVRVLPISEDAVGHDRHPIAIWCDGLAFEPAAPSAERKKRSKDVLEFFSSITTALPPAYGSILISWPLPSPTEVAARPDGFEFSDFYLSSRYVGARVLENITQAIDEFHRVHLDHGVLFLTSGLFSSPPVRDDGVGGMAARAIAAARSAGR